VEKSRKKRGKRGGGINSLLCLVTYYSHHGAAYTIVSWHKKPETEGVSGFSFCEEEKREGKDSLTQNLVDWRKMLLRSAHVQFGRSATFFQKGKEEKEKKPWPLSRPFISRRKRKKGKERGKGGGLQTFCWPLEVGSCPR